MGRPATAVAPASVAPNLQVSNPFRSLAVFPLRPGPGDPGPVMTGDPCSPTHWRQNRAGRFPGGLCWGSSTWKSASRSLHLAQSLRTCGYPDPARNLEVPGRIYCSAASSVVVPLIVVGIVAIGGRVGSVVESAASDCGLHPLCPGVSSTQLNLGQRRRQETLRQFVCWSCWAWG